MIICENLRKTYKEQVVIKDFSFKFKDNGFYLLFGESGSGKTTFLNIISGFTDFDAGKIYIDEKEYEKQVDQRIIKEMADYITQDTFFVDFLNVEDNLKMIEVDEKYIAEMLGKFMMSEKKEAFPTTLSGGEKQRLALVRSLLADKKILYLDEPTAALDGENKVGVFEMLSRISKKILVICSSHDEEAKMYADEIIAFEKIGD